MTFTRQSGRERNERYVEEPDRKTFLPPVQASGQSDDDYRLVLIDLIAAVDKTKRDIKAQIHSNAIRSRDERVSVDQVWLRRAKDKIDHLTREREEIRKVLHIVNERIKNRRQRQNRTKANETMGKVFMQVAEERLPPDVYDSLLDEAAERMLER